MANKKKISKKDFGKNKLDYIARYTELRLKLGRDPKGPELMSLGLTKDTIRYYFGNTQNLDVVARQANPDKFSDVRVDSLYSPKHKKRLAATIKNKKRFVVTTAVVGGDVDVAFFDSIKNYCKLNDAELLVLLATDPAARSRWSIDKLLDKEHIVLNDLALNSNIFLSTIKLSAKHIDPITGLQRIGQRNGSFIYASPKQRMVMVPVSNTKMPHSLMTTGAITKPKYDTNRYMSERTAYIADNDHVMGAIIVELEENDNYHFRQVQSSSHDGSFIDLGVRYTPTKTGIVQPEALIMGDWHSGETDQSCKAAIKEICTALKPKKLVFHDILNGLSINHHEEHKKILKAQRARDNQLSLADEIKTLMQDLGEMQDFADQLVIVKSNHDEFLERYLDEGKYVSDPQNKLISLELALAMAKGFDPLQYAVEEVYKMWPFPKGKLRWLQRDEDYKIAGIQLGAHGDLGANGARGTLRAMEQAYGNSVSGHSHTPEILRGAWRVGTSSLLRLTYNRGASSWLHTHCLVYPNGSRQLINCVDGSWRLKK